VNLSLKATFFTYHNIGCGMIVVGGSTEYSVVDMLFRGLQSDLNAMVVMKFEPDRRDSFVFNYNSHLI